MTTKKKPTKSTKKTATRRKVAARKKPVRLPNKLSALLRIAVKDAKACEADPRYKLAMDTWHTPRSPGGVCEVCLAGSVMAKTLGLRRDVSASPYSYTTSVERRLRALDYMRMGEFDYAAGELDLRIGPDQADALKVAADAVKPNVDEKLRAPWVAYEVAEHILKAANL
jgi:hypothetical protein